MKPVTEFHDGICVVRDDLHEGGTKGHIFEHLYSKHKDIVYACAAFSKTQVSLARAAKTLGKKATIFAPNRKELTPETERAIEFGADVHLIRPGYLTVIRKHALNYTQTHDAYLAPLGFDTPEVIKALSEIAKLVYFKPDEVWCAAGTGVLTRSLQLAWSTARHVAVQVGKDCDIGKASRVVYPEPLSAIYEDETAFPSERHFDAKAWHICQQQCDRHKKVLFWNVLGDE